MEALEGGEFGAFAVVARVEVLGDHGDGDDGDGQEAGEGEGHAHVVPGHPVKPVLYGAEEPQQGRPEQSPHPQSHEDEGDQTERTDAVPEVVQVGVAVADH